jgi:hypothetical protein
MPDGSVGRRANAHLIRRNGEADAASPSYRGYSEEPTLSWLAPGRSIVECRGFLHGLEGIRIMGR